MLDRNLTTPAVSQEWAIADGGDAWYEHAYKYPVAVAGDLAQTVVNSAISIYNFAVPESIEAEHIDRYSFMTNSIEEYAKENRAAVGFGSFMAGAILPGLGISKAMSLARTGKGVWGYALRGVGLATFNKKAMAAANKAKDASMKGELAATEMQRAMRSTKFWVGAEALAENVAYEASVYALMQEHDFFEAGYNPTIGAAGVVLGTGLTGVLKWAAVNSGIKGEMMAAREMEMGLAMNNQQAVRGAHMQLGPSHGYGTVLEGYKLDLADYTTAGTRAKDMALSQVTKDTISHLTQQTETRALDTLRTLATPELKALSPVRDQIAQPHLAAWELEEVLGVVDTRSYLPPGSKTYKEPDKFKMFAHYAMGQRGQVGGVTKVTASLKEHALEAGIGPYTELAPGHYAITTDNQFWQLLKHGDGLEAIPDPAYATIDALGNTIVPNRIPPPMGVQKLHNLVSIKQDPTTGVWTADLRKIKGPSVALQYLAWTMQGRGAQQVEVLFGGKGKQLDGLYNRAVRHANEALLKNIDRRYSSVAKAEADLPEYMSEYQVLRRWDGQTVAQSSITAHMTKGIGHIAKGDERAIGTATEAMDWQRHLTHNPGSYTDPALVPTLRPMKELPALPTAPGAILPPTTEYDKIIARSIIGADNARVSLMNQHMDTMANLLGAGHITRIASIASHDFARLQAAIINNIPTAYTDPVGAMQLAKVKFIDQAMLITPDIDDFSLAMRTNMPVEMVGRTRQELTNLTANTLRGDYDEVMRRVTMGTSKDDWMVYRSVGDAKAAIAEPSVSILGRAKHPTITAAQQAGKLDKEALNAMERNIVETASLSAGASSPLVYELFTQLVDSANTGSVRDWTDQLLADAGRGTIFSSLDFGMRKYKVAPAVSSLGSQMGHIINETGIKPAKEAIKPTANALVNDSAGLVQFEHVRNALDGLSPEMFAGSRGLVFDQGKIVLHPATKTDPAVYLKYTGTNNDIEVLPVVEDFIQAFQDNISKDLFKVRSAIANMLGKSMKAPRNIWFPYSNPSSSYIAYAFDQNALAAGHSPITRIMGRDAETFKQAIADFKGKNAAALDSGTMQLHLRNQQDLAAWLRVHNLAELEGMTTPLPTMRKSGIAGQKVTGSPQVIADIMKGVEDEYNRVASQYLRIANSDIFSKLDDIEKLHQGVQDTGAAKNLLIRNQKKTSPATMAKAGLLNRSMLNESQVMPYIDNTYSLLLENADRALRKNVQHIQEKFKLGAYNPKHYTQMVTDLQNAGVPVPWQTEMEYAIARTPELKPIAKEYTATANSVTATLAIRLADLSHPIITTLSAPIIMATEGVGQYGMTGMGAAKLMHEVARDWTRQAVSPGQYPLIQEILKEGHRLGHTVRRVSEATETLTRNFGSKNWFEKMKGPEAVKALSVLSDKSESMTREMAYLAGYRLAERMNPTAAKELLHSHAALFTNRAMGNYTSHQRPVLFQGAAGQAIGLFQTFMWTMGQNLFRYAENQQMKAIAGFLGGYAGMFGVSSLPMYAHMDKAIGEWNKAKDNEDITQIIYRAFGNQVKGHDRSVAEYLLFGAPSTLFQTAFWTRSELQPRLPMGEGLTPLPPAINAAAEAFAMLNRGASHFATLQETQPYRPFSNMKTAVLEGVAMQSLFRPAARLSELALGSTIDRKGETVVSGDDLYGPWPIFSHILGSRPLKEQVIRNYRFRHDFYETANNRETAKLRATLRSAAREGGDVSSIMGRYLQEGGTPQGWRQAVNETMLTESMPGAEGLRQQASKMPGIAAIMEGYAF